MTADYLLVGNGEYRRLHLASQHSVRLSEMREIVWFSLTVRDGESCMRLPTPSTANALRIIEGFGRDVPKENIVQIAEIDSEFECCRATQHINASFLEVSLKLASLVFAQLSRMLLHT